MLTVATVVFDDVHAVVEDGFVVALKLTFDPTQIDDDPLITGNGFTITVLVLTQPLLFVYDMIVEPSETADTNPPFVTVAIAVVDETQGLVVAAVGEPLS